MVMSHQFVPVRPGSSYKNPVYKSDNVCTHIGRVDACGRNRFCLFQINQIDLSTIHDCFFSFRCN